MAKQGNITTVGRHSEAFATGYEAKTPDDWTIPPHNVQDALDEIRAVGGGNDPDAIHDNVAGEITAVLLKTVPFVDDSLLIEDSQASDIKRRMVIGTIPINASTQLTSGEVSITRGGTGQASKTPAFDALAPGTTKGDTIVHDGTDHIRLAVGSDTQVLTADSGEASGVKWAAGGGGGNHNLLSATHSDALTETLLAGDLIIANATPKWSRLAKGTDADVLTLSSGLPVWSAPAGGSNALLDGSSHTDTVAQAVTRGSIIYGNATPKWDELVIGAANRVLRSDGTDVAWGQVALTADVTGLLPIANGGSNASSFALTDGLVTYNGTKLTTGSITAVSNTLDEVIVIQAQGASGVSLFNSSGTRTFLAGGSGTLVNYILATGKTTGLSPSVGVAGETNLDLLLIAAGTGVVKAGGIEVVTLTGTQTLTNKSIVATQLTGSIVDARVQESNVTQHEAAINHDALTNFLTAEHVDWAGASAGTIHITNFAALQNVVEDTTPQLGGMLDVNAFALGDGTLKLLDFVEDASAVNYFEMENQATGGGPILRATGTDANVALVLEPKQNGAVVIGSSDSNNGGAAVFQKEFSNGTKTANFTVDWNNGNKQSVTINVATVTISFTDPPGAGHFTLRVIGGTTPATTVTWPSGVKWPRGGRKPDFSEDTADEDIFTFYFTDQAAGNYYHGSVLPDSV